MFLVDDATASVGTSKLERRSRRIAASVVADYNISRVRVVVAEHGKLVDVEGLRDTRG